MTLQYIPMPLFTDFDYSYQISLEGQSYTFRAYYNQRATGWFFELSFENGAPIVIGERLVALYPILIDYAIPSLTGYIWLEPVGASVEKYRDDPENLSKYFKCFYIFQTED